MLSDQAVLIRTRNATLDGRLTVPENPTALILIVGLGATFHQEWTRYVAAELQKHCFGTLIADLLTPGEQQLDSRTGHFRVNAPLLADRIREIAGWLRCVDSTRHLPLGIFATGFAASAAIVAAATDLQPFALALYAPRIDAIGARLDRREIAPTLLLRDEPVPEGERGVTRPAREAVAWFCQYAPVVTPA